MATEPIERIDNNDDLRKKCLSYCRLARGQIWEDPIHGHRVGCLDASNKDDVLRLMGDSKTTLAIQDPPYNIIVGNANTGNLPKMSVEEYIGWCRKWVSNTLSILTENSSLYIWLGADQTDGFQPLADFMIMMREFSKMKSRSFITMRNQRGYGTQKNWMAVRQELLYYIKGVPKFNVEAEYTDIPKILRGYYKEVNGQLTENMERSRSNNIRAGNVWVDIQQVFYRLEENVPGCYAQKPLKATERIIRASSGVQDLVVDFFSHAGTTLLACEKLNRRCFTADIDPVFTEISIRRLEHYRKTGRTGWQFESPFPEVHLDSGKDQDRQTQITDTKYPVKRDLFDYLSAST
jgi:site-specific DNA-methyltransferase (adenine-specific)